MRRDQRPGLAADQQRLLEGEGPAGSVLREYARRTGPAEVERWLPSRGRRTPSLRPAAVAGGLLAAFLGSWLFVHSPPVEAPGGRGGAGGSEGASGRELGIGGGRGSSGSI